MLVRAVWFLVTESYVSRHVPGISFVCRSRPRGVNLLATILLLCSGTEPCDHHHHVTVALHSLFSSRTAQQEEDEEEEVLRCPL